MWPISFEPVPDRSAHHTLPVRKALARFLSFSLAACAVALTGMAVTRDAMADCTIETPCKIATTEADTAGCILVGIPQETGLLWVSNGALRYSEINRDGHATTTEVDTAGAVMTGFSLAYDVSRRPVVAFGTSRGLAIAMRAGGPGQPFTRMDLEGEASQVASPSLARTSTGVGVAYCDVTQGCLKYSEHTAKGWKTVVVDRAHGADGVCLLASGSARAIAYYDPTNGDLRVARRRNGAWSSRVVDAVGDVGLHPSMVGNPATGRLGVAYCDRTGTLKYASTQGGPWSAQTVKTEGEVGRCAAIAYGGSVADSVAVAYYDATHDRLAVAEKVGTWRRSFLDPVAGSGVAVSAALQSRGTAHFAYVRSNGDLLYLKRRIGERRADAEQASR